MKLINTDIKDLFIIEPTVFEDERGYFYESYNLQVFNKHNLNFNFVQDNQSRSSFGVVRGLHFQLAPYAQTKLIRVLEGKIFDVAVDIRKNSPTFGKWAGVELSSENKKQLLVPKGFAHGFSVLSPSAVVFYKCDEFYNKESEGGIIYNDKSINVDWKLDPEKMILSAKDKILPGLDKAEINF
ncbi:MAG: dTDP-4-dehydrorhamnose 3,5-epimerase [Bacteroidetes bacterium GWF2_38_335]|nr:MAG: dTDP-4-dehydrorhamnose 3,5-epimerase [Bacteroidetes bacterium GWF2_38_335]OFY79029.1 MAG: dTDP-4-dehydrorhamnose 3,5-epimerase [Bacteroidetes bacterium RIFOXYA12_FULL_38_20]HBS86109.1 dTDP-4-dehydrorhamnose 3,5-epimerase [Bacteroidales bacterium]